MCSMHSRTSHFHLHFLYSSSLWPRCAHAHPHESRVVRCGAPRLISAVLGLRIYRTFYTLFQNVFLVLNLILPRSILTSFFDNYDDRSCNLDSFSAFLITRVQRSKRVEERLNPSLIMSEKEPARRQKPTERSFAETVDDKHSCRHCSGQHHLASCADFQKLSVRQRWCVVKPTNLCLNCLKPGHRCNSCLSAACKAWSKKHHALLHPVRNTGTARQGVEQTHAAQTSSTTFMAVPVWNQHQR